MSYSRMSGGGEYDAFFDGVMRDVTQVGIAISQQVEGRQKRVLGALAGGDKKSKEQKLLIALSVHRQGEILRTGYYMPLLVRVNVLMKRHFVNGQFAKLDALKSQIVFYYATYEILITISEAALVLFDAYFDQWHTLTTMGFRPPDRDENGRMSWLSADVDALETARKQHHAARKRAKDAGRYVRPDSLPTFRAAFDEARVIAEEMDEFGRKVALSTMAPDLNELSSRIDKLAEYVMKESRPAEDTRERDSTEPREIMTPTEEDSDE